jgi:hypothetical protein
MNAIRQLLWRFKCLSDIDAVADDFVSWVLPHIDLSSLDFGTAIEEYRDPWFAWRRIIAARYGIAANYKAPDGSPARRSWNRALWTKHGGEYPEALVDAIFGKVFCRLKTEAARRNNNPDESGRGDGMAPVTPPTPPDMRV